MTITIISLLPVIYYVYMLYYDILIVEILIENHII